ncbi:UNVERIFIED_CONTAM: Polygalacturonase 1 beta-like protein 1 [Sesamum radiatum]|uniref:Polygalacturonase 1 beta-like protein 1 n=1 Tax=Sesamum radiatum TaxID=300843 RepID=A0AAW2WM52_SESRA
MKRMQLQEPQFLQIHLHQELRWLGIGPNTSPTTSTNPHFFSPKPLPLSPVESAFFTKLAAEKALSAHLSAFCSAADLFCLHGSKPAVESHKSDANFALYTNKNFANYGNARLGGVDQFKNYSDGVNFATGSFARYSRGSTGHHEGFASYADDGNVASSNFTSYGSSATGGAGDFKTYMPQVNVPDLRFTSYDSDGNGHKLTFASYADDTNSGNQGFTGYGKNGNAVPVEFTSYGQTSNVVGSTFTGYGELGNSANDSFKGYDTNANNPSNNFKNYDVGGNGGSDTFTNYRDSANAVGFKIYGVNNTFKEYAKKGVTFAQYTKPGSIQDGSTKVSSKMVNNGVEEGKFFRENMLKEGTVMKMPNIRDWMPKRSFLPRPITSRLPFSTAELVELKRTFQVEDNSTMEHVVMNALAECERAPSAGETKRCVGSVEDMIDFAVSVLGHDVVVRTTEGVKGSSQDVMIGKVKGINGGRVTKSVSCHQACTLTYSITATQYQKLEYTRLTSLK